MRFNNMYYNAKVYKGLPIRTNPGLIPANELAGVVTILQVRNHVRQVVVSKTETVQKRIWMRIMWKKKIGERWN